MPDLDLRSNASFISSKEGGMPVSRTRSWMNISNSYCLRVSMVFSPRSGEQSRNIHESFYFSSTDPSTHGPSVINPERNFPAGVANIPTERNLNIEETNYEDQNCPSGR